jgi:hypothetical protein
VRRRRCAIRYQTRTVPKQKRPARPATTASNVGSYAIGQGSLAASSNYAVSYAGANLTVAARPIALTADAQGRLYGDTNPALTVRRPLAGEWSLSRSSDDLQGAGMGRD